MADNVAITAGSGTNVAADEVVDGTLGTVKVQYVKLMDGTLDGSGKPAADATNGLDVDVTRVIPGTSATHLGKAEDAGHSSGDTGVMALGVRQDTPAALATTDADYIPPIMGARGEQWVGLVGHDTTVRFSVATSGLTTATTLYTAGDVLDAELSITNAVRISGGRGVIEKVVAIDKSNNKAASLVELWFFNAASTPAANNAAGSWADADMDNHEGVIALPSFTSGDSALNRAVTWLGRHPFQCTATTLFCVPITRATHTAHFNAATDLVFKFQIRYE